MKKMRFALLCTATVVSTGFAGTYDIQHRPVRSGEIEATFTIGDFNLSTQSLQGSPYSSFSWDGGIQSDEMGTPDIGSRQFVFQLANNSDATVEIVSSQYVDQVVNYDLAPSRGTIYRNQNQSEISYTRGSVYQQDAFFPANPVSLLEPFVLRDVRGVAVKVVPAQYNPVTKVLRVYKSITFKLVEKNSENAVNPLPAIRSSIVDPSMASTYSDLFLNYAPWPNGLNEVGEILVVHTNRDSGAVNTYVKYKTEKGFKVTTKEVAKGTNVKTTIQDAYTANKNILYVQLFGDWEDIKSDVGTSGNAPMDPMLGCVAGTDKYPDIIIGRFSASSNAQALIQVNKAITYEKNPNQPWWKNALGIASAEGAGIGDDGEIDHVHINNIKVDKLLASKKYTDVKECYNTGSGSTVVGYVNSGLHLINYTGHGSKTAWSTTGTSNTNVSGMTNGDKLPIIISVACVNGEFHTTGDCFAEAWLRKDKGGAVATVMATINQPWQPPMRGQDYMNDLLTGGYTYSGTKKGTSTKEGRTTFGSIVFNGLALLYGESSSTSDLESIQTWTIFGDASLKVSGATVSVAPQSKIANENRFAIKNGAVSFAVAQPASVSCKVFSVSGRELLSQDFGTKNAGVHSVSMNMNALPQGMYVVSLLVGNQKFETKFIK